MKYQYNQDYTSKISSYFSIAATGFLLINLALGSENAINSFLKDHPYISIIAAILVLTCPFTIPFFYTRIKLYKLEKRKFSNTIIEKQEALLDIYKKGKKAYYSERIVFCKIGKKEDDNFEGNIEVNPGTIEPLSALNCAYNLNLEKNYLEFEYADHCIQSESYYSTFIKRHVKFLIFTAILRDAFTAKNETWNLIPKHYCKNYTLQVILPKKAVLKSAKIVKVIDPNTTVAIPHIQPIITMSNGRTKITMQIVDYDHADKLRLSWTIK